MPYTHATILEVLRHRPIAPMGVPHKAAYQTQLLGYTIPANTGDYQWRVSEASVTPRLHSIPRGGSDPAVTEDLIQCRVYTGS